MLKKIINELDNDEEVKKLENFFEKKRSNELKAQMIVPLVLTTFVAIIKSVLVHHNSFQWIDSLTLSTPVVSSLFLFFYKSEYSLFESYIKVWTNKKRIIAILSLTLLAAIPFLFIMYLDFRLYNANSQILFGIPSFIAILFLNTILYFWVTFTLAMIINIILVNTYNYIVNNVMSTKNNID